MNPFKRKFHERAHDTSTFVVIEKIRAQLLHLSVPKTKKSVK